MSSYRCPSGVWTIGYGHTGKDVRPDMVINLMRAGELFDADLARFEAGLDALISKSEVTLTQGQYDALVSFAYNVGLDAFKGSTLWCKVKTNPADPTIPAELRRWVYSKGVKLPGLVRRREGEARIYERG